jgi:hypothetical protein
VKSISALPCGATARGSHHGTPFSGDANGDCAVDSADLAIWQAEFGKPVVPSSLAEASAILPAAIESSAALSQSTTAEVDAVFSNSALAENSISARLLAHQALWMVANGAAPRLQADNGHDDLPSVAPTTDQDHNSVQPAAGSLLQIHGKERTHFLTTSDAMTDQDGVRSTPVDIELFDTLLDKFESTDS